MLQHTVIVITTINNSNNILLINKILSCILAYISSYKDNNFSPIDTELSNIFALKNISRGRSIFLTRKFYPDHEGEGNALGREFQMPAEDKISTAECRAKLTVYHRARHNRV